MNLENSTDHASGLELPDTTSRSSQRVQASPTSGEYACVALILLAFFLLQLRLAFLLDHLHVFAQYNILFDSDPIHYKGVISGGWGAGGLVHSLLGLAINLPVRLVDIGLSLLGVSTPGAFRNAAPLLLPPLMAAIGGLFWWRSAVVMTLPRSVRILGLVFSQTAFSNTVFASVPESYPVSGMLLSVMLYMTVSALRQPYVLHERKTQLRWLALACVMGGVTVTNGLMCLFVWTILRLKTMPLRQLLREAVIGLCALLVFVVCAMSVSKAIFPALPRTAPVVQPASSTPAWRLYFEGSVAGRAAHYPFAVLTSVIAPPVKAMRNQLIRPAYRHQVQFSIQNSGNSLLRALAWVLLLAVSACVFLRGSRLAYATLGIVAFNGLMHSVFGLETFLYSQHWVAFITFAIVVAIRHVAPARSGTSILALLACASAIASALAWSTMLGHLA